MREFGTLKLPFLQCPSAVEADQLLANWALEHLAKGNYVANFGSDTFMSFQSPRTAGAFGVIVPAGTDKVRQVHNDVSQRGRWKAGWGQGVRFRDFNDGISNTLLVSEILTFDDPADGRGTWSWAGMGASTFTAKYGPNSPQNDVLPACATTIPTSDLLHCQQVQNNGNVWASVRSNHTSGVNAALADGSVRFFNDAVNLDVWHGLATRAGHEAVEMP